MRDLALGGGGGLGRASTQSRAAESDMVQQCAPYLYICVRTSSDTRVGWQILLRWGCSGPSCHAHAPCCALSMVHVLVRSGKSGWVKSGFLVGVAKACSVPWHAVVAARAGREKGSVRATASWLGCTWYIPWRPKRAGSMVSASLHLMRMVCITPAMAGSVYTLPEPKRGPCRRGSQAELHKRLAPPPPAFIQSKTKPAAVLGSCVTTINSSRVKRNASCVGTQEPSMVPHGSWTTHHGIALFNRGSVFISMTLPSERLPHILLSGKT